MKYVLGLILVLILVFAVSGISLASPFVAGEQGQFTVFGEYNLWWPAIEIGAAYSLTDSIAIGVLANNFNGGYYGIYACLTLKHFVIQCDLWPSYVDEVLINALYTFELDKFTFGVGAGVDNWLHDFHLPYLTADVNFAATDNFSIYGSINRYFGSYDATWIEIGASLQF